ncbi:MAG: V4R domain-containing protein [Candidatus Bathyarchaeia archaeon]
MKTILYPSKKIATLFYDDTRRGIIRELRAGPKTVSELAKILKKRKPTIVHHIEILKKEGIVERKESPPEDRREKPYGLTSILTPLESIDKKEYESMKLAVEDQFKSFSSLEAAESRVKLFVSLFRAIRISALVYGVDMDEILRHTGRIVGEALTGNFSKSNMEVLLRELAVFWSKNSLGEMVFKIVKPNLIEILVYECYECAGMPKIGCTLCAFDAGIIEGVIGRLLSSNAYAMETECWGNGYQHCKFIVALERD